MKTILLSFLLLPFVCYGQSVGDLIFPKATATGSEELYVTPSATKLLGLDGSSNPTTVSLTGTGLTLTSNTLGLTAADNWLLTLPIPAEDTITTEQVGMGWADGRFTLQTPVGAFQLYETGSPLEPTLYWPGRLQIDTIEANLVTANFTGSQITSGTIPTIVMLTSTTKPMRQWQDSSSYAGANGLTYGNTGPAGVNEPSTPGRYFPVIDVIDDNSTGNYLDGEIRTAGQLKTDLSLNAVENTALSTWAGTSNITTLGTISTGVWQGTAIGDTYISSAATWNAKQTGSAQLTSLSGLSYAGNAGKFIRVNAGETAFELATVSGSGTVTSVALSAPTGFAVTGSPITTTGTLALSYDAGYQGYTTTEASKLAGIEAGADVTDAANVAAAGAVMVGGALGTPSSGTMTNVSGTAASLTAGNATTAEGLKSATTTVVVSGATAPTSGQVLTATSSTAANWQTPSGGGGGPTVTLTVLGSDQTSTSTSYADVTGLTASLDASAKYQFEFFVEWRSSSAAEGIGLAINGPSSPTTLIAHLGINATSTYYQFLSVETTYNSGPLSTSGAYTTGRVAHVRGVIVTGASSGTLALRYRAETGGANSATVKAGSSLVLTKIP